MKMKRSQLNLPRISFVVLSFLICVKAATAAGAASILTGAEWKQDKSPHNTYATRNVQQQQQQLEQPHNTRRYMRRPQPFNALLTSVGQLSDSPRRQPHHAHLYLHHNDFQHAGHLMLTKTNEHTLKRLLRAVNDGEDGEDGMDDDNDYSEHVRQSRAADDGGNVIEQWISDNFGEMLGSVMVWVLRCIDAIWKFFATAEVEPEE